MVKTMVANALTGCFPVQGLRSVRQDRFAFLAEKGRFFDLHE